MASGVAISSLIVFAMAMSALDLLDGTLHVEVSFRRVVVFTVENFLEATDRVSHWNLSALPPGKNLRHAEGLAEETLNLSGASNRELVVRRKLIHAENRDDVLEVLVALEDLLNAARDVVVLLSGDLGRQGARGRGKGINRRIDAQFGDRTFEHDGRVKVRKGCGRRRVGQVVGGNIHGLKRCDGAALGRRDSLLESSHFGCQRRLVSDRARSASQQRRNLGARLGEAEDVIDEEQHILVLFIAEVLGDGEAGERDAKARPRRFVHLSVDQCDLRFVQLVGFDNARVAHLVVEVVAFARPLADTREYGDAAVELGNVIDELHDDYRLAHSRAAEGPYLAALQEWTNQIDHFDSGGQHLRRCRLVLERWRRAMNRIVLLRFDRTAFIHWIAGDIEDAAHHALADGNGNRPAVVGGFIAALEPFGARHGDSPNASVSEVLLYFEGQFNRIALHLELAGQGVVDPGQRIGKFHIHHRTYDFDDFACFHLHTWLIPL